MVPESEIISFKRRIYFEPIFIPSNQSFRYRFFSLTCMEKLSFELLIHRIVAYKSSRKNYYFVNRKSSFKMIRQMCIHNNNLFYLIVLRFASCAMRGRSFCSECSILYSHFGFTRSATLSMSTRRKWKYKTNWVEFENGFLVLMRKFSIYVSTDSISTIWNQFQPVQVQTISNQWQEQGKQKQQ